MTEQTRAELRVGCWIRDGAIPSFVVQLIGSTVGAILIGMVAVVIPAIVTAAVGRNTSGGNLADRIGEQPIFTLLNEPYFVAPVAAGFVLGMFSYRVFRSRSAAWVWAVPMAVLIYNVTTWRAGGFGPYWQDVWNNYFGSQCESSGCFYEWLVTAPFYTSVAYTLGWISRNLIRRLRAG